MWGHPVPFSSLGMGTHLSHQPLDDSGERRDCSTSPCPAGGPPLLPSTWGVPPAVWPDDLGVVLEPTAYTQLAFLQFLGSDAQNNCFPHSLWSKKAWVLDTSFPPVSFVTLGKSLRWSVSQILFSHR